MDQRDVKIRITDPKGNTSNITELCRAITWSGNWNSAARTLSFSVAAGDNIPRIPLAMGSSVQLWDAKSGALLMNGHGLERVVDSLSYTVDMVAWDGGIYLTRNQVYLRVEKQCPETVTAALCTEYGIPVGALAATGVAVTRNFLGVNLYKTIMTLYTLAAEQTGKKYRARFRGRAFEVVEFGQADESIVLVPGSNLLSSTTKESAAQMVNSVAVYDEGGNRLQTYRDKDSAALYGLMENAIRAGAHEDPAGYAKQVMKENGPENTITVRTLGDVRLITGSTVTVREPATGLCGLFWIRADSHSWAKGRYETKLTLSLETMMDEQRAGR